MTRRRECPRPRGARGVLITALIFGCALVCLGLPERAVANDAEPARLLVIPHTHWEGAWAKTREGYLEAGLPNILKALYLLRKHPDYRFVLDQMCYVRPFLERYPSEEAAFRQFLTEGRLQIVGGTDTMHDTNVPSGESIVRQYLLSKSYFRERLNYEVTTGWAIDTFGHNAQLPQILKLAGMKSYWFSRGAPAADMPSEIVWQGIDGTQIPAFWLPFGYSYFWKMPPSQSEFDDLIRGRFDSLTAFSRGAERVLLSGTDVEEPAESLPALLERFNRSQSPPFKAQFALPQDFEALVAKRTARHLVRGELNPVFQGGYSSRIELKQAMRNLERLLTTTEKLSALVPMAGGLSNPQAIERAWEPVLFNQAHDLSAGSMGDKAYQDSLYGFDHARQLAEQELSRLYDSMMAHIDTSGEGVPVVVFNSLGWRRTDVVEVDVPFSEPAVRQFALFDPEGRSVPVQTLKVIRNGDGGIRQARIAFIARDLPAMGHGVYHIVPHVIAPQAAAGPTVQTSKDQNHRTIENEFYRASFDLWTGAMTSLILKDNNWEVLAGPGNVLAREYDGGDLWQLQGQLSHGRVAAKMPVLAPRPTQTLWSNEFVGDADRVVAGAVFAEFRIGAHPFGKNTFATRVRLYSGLHRIDVSTDLLNQDEFVRYRAVFPTTIANGTAVHEIPFGAVERSQSEEFPAQNWIDYGDGRKGLTLLNRGIPGNNVSEGTMMLSLMRSARIPDVFKTWFDPGDQGDTGLGVGRSYTLDYALVPHAGDWRAAAPWRAGLEFNNPLIARTAAAHAGQRPARWGLLEISQADVVVSALKPGKDGTVVLRVYEPAGKASRHVRIGVNAVIRRVQETNLLEDAGTQIESSANSFTFDLRPFEIKTFKLSIAP